jgi:hypothetical protein
MDHTIHWANYEQIIVAHFLGPAADQLLDCSLFEDSVEKWTQIIGTALKANGEDSFFPCFSRPRTSFWRLLDSDD